MAGVVGCIIAIITTFAGADDPVAADIGTTVGLASVLVHVIAIIAGFKAWLAVGHIGAVNAIATAGQAAIAAAAVSVVPVAVVTGFTLLDDLIAAGGQSAGIGARVVIYGIAVVAALKAFPYGPISTASGLAVGKTGIRIIAVAVVAGFKAFLPLASVAADEAITAAGHEAEARTGITIVTVAVVALFVTTIAHSRIIAGDPVAACGEPTVIGTGVAGHVVAIIAVFTDLDLSVTTLGRDVSHHHLFVGTSGEPEDAAKSKGSVTHDQLQTEVVEVGLRATILSS